MWETSWSAFTVSDVQYQDSLVKTTVAYSLHNLHDIRLGQSFHLKSCLVSSEELEGKLENVYIY